MERRYTLALVVLGTGLMGGCASENSGLFGNSSMTTSSVAPAASTAPATAVAAARVDPACIALTAQIDGLRKEGVAERLQKVSTGKTKSVSVKRESLAKMMELDKANADFQQKCSTLSPKPAQSAAVVAPATVAAAPTSATVRPVAAPAATVVAPVAQQPVAKP